RQIMADEYVRSMLKDKGRIPGLADIRDYYDEHADEFKSEDKVKWQDIFVPFARHAGPQAARDHAEAVRQQAAAGADFVALAKAQEAPEVAARRKNWDGIGTKRGEIPLDVAPTVWSLQPGQMSGLVQTPAGYHVGEVVGRVCAGVRTTGLGVRHAIGVIVCIQSCET